MPDKLEKSLSEYTRGRPKAKTQIAGLLGIFMGGIQQIEVPNRNGYVYVRLRNNTSELIQAWNDQVAVVYDLPVLVEWNGHRYIVTGRDTERYAPAGFGWGSQSPYLPKHGSQHSFAPELGYGGDPTWIYSRQIMPFATTPSGTQGSPVVWVQPHVYRNPTNGSWEYIGDDVSPDLLAAKPTGTFGRMLLLYWDLDSDSAKILTGSYFSESLTGTSQILPYVPTVSSQSHIPLSAIRLVSGTTGVLWDNIYDMRQWATTLPSPFQGGFAVWDEGIPIGTGTTLNFVGAGVTATISGSIIDVSIPGGGGGGSSVDTLGFAGLDEGVPLGTGTALNVRGSRAVLSRSGTMFALDISPDPQELIGLMGWDEGVPLGTGTILNVVGSDISLSLSGNVLQLSHTSTAPTAAEPILIYDDSVFIATGTKVSFNRNLTVEATGTSVFVTAPITTYFRVGVPTQINGNYYRVPDQVYASGSLGVFNNGMVLIPSVDYVEQLWVSGTYQYLSTRTGTHVVHYGVPCSPQTQPPTGTGDVVSDFALQDSDSVLLEDSDGVQLLDSDG